MKILIDARMYGLENSGIGRYLIELIGNLVKVESKFDFVILLRKKYFDELNFTCNWKKILADFRHYSLEEQIKLPFIIKSENPDLIHFPHFNIPILVNKKFVVTIHDMTIHDQSHEASLLPYPIFVIKKFFYKFVFLNAVSRSTKIIVPSFYVKRRIVDYYKVKSNKIRVVYEGISMNKSLKYLSRKSNILKKNKLRSRKYLFYAGNVYPHKNLDIVLDALYYLRNNCKGLNLSFVIAGNLRRFEERLKRRIKTLNLEDNIKLLGFINDEEMSLLYNHSMAFVYPSLSEGFGLQGLEAISSGTILIASDIPVFREIYGSFAYYFDPYNYRSLAKVVKKIFQMDREERKRYLVTARKFIKRYSWEKMANDTFNIYKNILF